MASRRAQDRVTAVKVREQLARRRRVEEAVLIEAAAALDGTRETEQALCEAQDRRTRALGTVAWLLAEAEAAAVLGVPGQALRAAKRTLTGARAQQHGAELLNAGEPDPPAAGPPDTAATTAVGSAAPVIH